jgi:hypothetical protein
MISARFGSGLSFPLRVGADGRLATSADEDNVRESLRLILLTEPGERVMREDFGCGLKRFLFEPNTTTTRALIQERVANAVVRWEPRVRVDEVSVDADPDEPTVIHVVLRFRLVATNAAGQLGLTLRREI